MNCCGDQTDCTGTLTVTIQINGSRVSTMQVPANICNEPLKALAIENEQVAAQMGDRLEKEIRLEGKDIVNIIL